jgi:hypothetical protein
MNENEKIQSGETAQSEAEIVRGWLVELDREIRARERSIKLFEGRVGDVYIKLVGKLGKELLELQRTRQEYAELLKETEKKT